MPTIEVTKSTYVGVFVALVAAFAFLLLMDSATAHEVPTLPECSGSDVLVYVQTVDGNDFECRRVET